MPPKYSKEYLTPLLNGAIPKVKQRISPCEEACPAGNCIQRMETLIKDNQAEKAHLALLTRNPFPGVTGRVCPHPCEEHCNRRHYDQGISIRALERFASDAVVADNIQPATATGKKIAIIGSGPAGMSCAWFCRLLGHEVSVFEAAPVAGGFPRFAVPDFRLPKNIVERESGRIFNYGVNIHLNTKVGEDITFEDILAHSDACVIAVGTQKERILNIPGKEYITPAVSFLKESNLFRKKIENKCITILGGGGVAFDAAFTAIRLGAKQVTLIFPEDMEHIKAPAEEIKQAIDEGIILRSSHLAKKIENHTVYAEEIKSFKFTEEGDIEIQSAFHEISEYSDMIICASGLIPDIEFLENIGLNKNKSGLICVDEHMQTNIKKVFAAGDIVTGPASVASAIGSGRRTAMGIHAYLTDTDSLPQVILDADNTVCITGTAPDFQMHTVQFDEIYHVDYHPKMQRRQTKEELNTLLPFSEINKGLSAEDAQAEAERCLHCGQCIKCGTCVERCPCYVLEMDEETGPFVRYPDECWHCAACRIGCPTGAISIKFPITMLV